jgi:methionyl aminopeptidase
LRLFSTIWSIMLNKISIKTASEVKIMAEAGRKLGRVKKSLMDSIKIGTNAAEIEELANKLISKEGAKPSFKMVPGYKWATCINVNDGLVHGIPGRNIVFKRGDVVSLDVGLFYKGFHSDTSDTKGLEVDKDTAKFLKTGREALKKAIGEVNAGRRIYDISEAIEKTVRSGGYSPIEALVGHGVGRELHEGPPIPCFVRFRRESTPEMKPGMVLAIEVMYAQGKPEVEVVEDGWTIRMRDGKIAALYEETVAVTPSGPLVLTEAN